jgi:Tol biopolymer transport system component
MLALLPNTAYASLSPNQERLAFITGTATDTGLFVANLDGSGKRQLAARAPPEYLWHTAWSPDSKTVAFGVFSQRGRVSSSLAAIPVTGGPEQLINARVGYNMAAVLWMPDGHGLVAEANEQFPYFQVWYFSYPGGQTRRITNDLNSYRGLSLTADGGALVAVQNETISHLWVTAPGDPRGARQISTGRLDGSNRMAWAANGSLYFEAPDSNGDTRIWNTTADGAGRRQITTGGLNGQPAPCGDGRYLLFVSYRAGNPHIWRSDLDGGNLRQLTNSESAWNPSCSPDGSWLTYSSFDSKSYGIWRMPIDGGAPVRIWDRAGTTGISPNGKSVLICHDLFGAAKASIIPAEGGLPLRSFDRVSEFGGSACVSWSADGAALLYAKSTGGVSNMWRQPLDGSQPKQVTGFASQRITSFAVSRDGNRLALARGTTTSDVVLIRDMK